MDIKTSFISYICNQITNIEVKMVLEIRLSNMFSFRDEVTLDLQAAKIQTKKARELEGNLFSVDGEQMLKSVALFGANASGKSNVIKAIRACVNMVRSSHNYNVDTKFAISPFKFEDYANKHYAKDEQYPVEATDNGRTEEDKHKAQYNGTEYSPV